jgi:hypothetical protein
MSRIGRLGGKSSAGRRQATRGNGHPGTTSATPHSPEHGSSGGNGDNGSQYGDSREAEDSAA